MKVGRPKKRGRPKSMKRKKSMKRGGRGGLGFGFGFGFDPYDFSDESDDDDFFGFGGGGFSSDDDLFGGGGGGRGRAATIPAPKVLVNKSNVRAIQWPFAQVADVRQLPDSKDTLSLSFSKPGECFKAPKQNEKKSALLPLKTPFIKDCKSLKVSFASEAAAVAFKTALESVLEDLVAAKEEKKANPAPKGAARPRGPQVAETAEELLKANPALQSADSWAGRCIRKWRLFGPFDVAAAPIQWKNYFEQRSADEARGNRRFEADSYGEYGDFDGESGTCRTAMREHL